MANEITFVPLFPEHTQQNENAFVPLFPGQTVEMAEHTAQAERQYVEGTRWQDGPTTDDDFFSEILPLANEMKRSEDGRGNHPETFDPEEHLLQTIPLRGLKHADRKALTRGHHTRKK